jgi:hypothetical protein
MTLDNLGYPLRAFWFSCSKRLKRIIWLSNVSTLSVSGEGYSRTASFTLSWISTVLFLNLLVKDIDMKKKKIKKKRKRKKKEIPRKRHQ